MPQFNINQKLDELLATKFETEVIEFKEAKNDFSFEELGKYFSALSNEANLHNVECAWLVFGVEDKKHKVVGTNYRLDDKSLNNLKEEIAKHTTGNISFIEIYKCSRKDQDGNDKRILVFQIPAAPKGIPTAFKRINYGRDGEALVGLSTEEFERIRSQNVQTDWSAGIVPDATIEDLDESAIKKARELYKVRHSSKADEVDSWDDITFLNKAKITQKGKITRTALLLLGKDESEFMLQPADPKIRWILLDSKGRQKAFHISGIPFLNAIDEIYSKIRIIRYQYIVKEGTLFPEEVDQYDSFTIRESLNNCIAHQDYTKGCRINVIEGEDQLTFENAGLFIPNSVEQVVKDNSPESHYRNPFLATAMMNLNLVETAGGGIRKLFEIQKKKFFPLPEYELSADKVKVTFTGKIINMDLARKVAKNPDISFDELFAVDKVAKGKHISETELELLKNGSYIVASAEVSPEINGESTYVISDNNEDSGTVQKMTGNCPEDKSLLDKMSNKMSNKEQERFKLIIGYLEKNDLITKTEAAKLLKVEDKTAQRLLSKAVELELLVTEGDFKGTVYKLNLNC